MEILAAMLCMFLVIVQTREDMVLIRRVPEISLLEILRQKLMSDNMDYEDENIALPKSRANSDSIKIINDSSPAPLMLHHNPYENAPDPLYNPYHVTQYNPNHHPHYKPLHNPGYASFRPPPYVLYETTTSPEETYSESPIFLAPQQPAYVQMPQRIFQQSQHILPPPRVPFKFNNRFSNPQYQLQEVTDLPNEPPYQQELDNPKQRGYINAYKPMQYRAYRYIPTKKSTVTVETFQTNSIKREKTKHVIPSKLVNSDTDFLFNQKATTATSMEVWKYEDDMATEQTFKGFKLASGITSIILSSFEEDYKLLKALEKNGFVERQPENEKNPEKEVLIVSKPNPKISATFKMKTELHPKINNNRNSLNPDTVERKREMKPLMRVKKREEEVDLEALLKKAIKRAEERTQMGPLSFQSYENGSYPLRRTFDRVRWKYGRELI